MKVSAIFGPPGTGKTSTLVEFARGQQGMFISYTKAAAHEAASRIPDGWGVKASTLHSLMFQTMRMNRSQVVDALKMKDFARAVGIPFKGLEDTTELQEGDEYMSVIQFANNRFMGHREAYDHFGCPGTWDRFIMCATSYVQWKKTYGYMDFDDMLMSYVAERPWKLSSQPKWHVFLDEAQDCSPLQWRAFSQFVSEVQPERVFIGGDDDQAIYEWSGANPHGMVEFVETHNGDTRVLEQSYRLPKKIHGLATDVSSRIQHRADKPFKPTKKSGAIDRYGTSELAIDKLNSIAPKGALILVRDRYKMEEVKKVLNRELIPYDVYGGYSPWTSKIAKEIKSGARPKTDVPLLWQEFYQQADLSQPIQYYVATIHGAKGREHDSVILDLELPYRVINGIALDPDAETRVQYVGVTRAKERLVLCSSNPIL